MAYYEINIAKEGHHLFATADRSLSSRSKTKLVYDRLKAAFPEEEGYSITISYWSHVGEDVDPLKLI
jgi:hypothetical protein